MENTVIQRIIQFKEESGLSTNKFAKQLGMSQSTVNDYICGNRKLAFALIERIAITFPNISLEWLIRGEGEMLLNDSGTKMPDDVDMSFMDSRLQNLIDQRIEKMLQEKFKKA